MNHQHISIISFGQFESGFLEKVSTEVERVLRLSIKVKEGHIDLSDFYDPARRQYNGNLLLKQMDLFYSADSFKTIGLFNVDLFIPILTYIFGQAYLNGNTGIVSIYRLSNERYSISPSENVLIDRAAKEIVHELGHSFGLIHCHAPDCVMRSSTYVEELDQKEVDFCSSCRKILLTGLT